ncbi:DUF6452 family protein [Altibacter sp. HG106]|uniref:DUF6452 family protein n=1 Tax=Altibacter sp. HG106 TaxID=3023937 RepID=UPI002350F5C3|nr:DUF6452 family protein [Altibacter sp. HG106]MDC7996171.1 DUF6452 family protein [Altibacter sp. HG106]
MKKTLWIAIFVMLTLNACTRDDICDQNSPTTPLLIITFQDFSNPENRKNVTDLVVRPVLDTTAILVAQTTDSIAIPLNVNQDITEFLFTREATDSVASNTDRVQFTYGRNNVYVNRACAFRTTYENLNGARTADTANWIISFQTETENVEDLSETHITILH